MHVWICICTYTYRTFGDIVFTKPDKSLSRNPSMQVFPLISRQKRPMARPFRTSVLSYYRMWSLTIERVLLL